MSVRLTDAEIEQLTNERKPLPQGFRFSLKSKRGHKEHRLDMIGNTGSRFRVIARQSNSNPLDFSVLLAYLLPNSNQWFHLRRYNGRSHEHTNKLEGVSFFDFHIHMATERYQDSMFKEEEAYAEPTDRFTDVNGASQCLLQDCGFVLPPERQLLLF